MAVDPQRYRANPSTHEASSPVQLHLDPDQIRPLIAEIVRAVLADLEANRFILINGKLALTEAEAAEYLGLNTWQLRDLRREGGIAHTRVVGNRVRYTANDLLTYLAKNSQPGT